MFSLRYGKVLAQRVSLSGNLFRHFASYPPHTIITMPALSPTMEQGNIAEWKKVEGDHVLPGQSLAGIETDKAVVDFEATDEGYIARIIVPGKTNDIKVGTPLGVIVEEKGDIGAFKDWTPSGGASTPKASSYPTSPASSTTATHSTTSASSSSPSNVVNSSSRVFVTPIARKMAKEMGVEVSNIIGSGPKGRILKADVVEQAATASNKQHAQQQQQIQQQQSASVPTPSAPIISHGNFIDYPHTHTRKAIAERLTQSKRFVPHYYLTIDVNVESALNLRNKLNSKIEGENKISLNDMIIKAAAMASKKVPECNSSWLDNAVRQYNYVDVSVAVTVNDGLVSPVVRDAHVKGFSDISSNVRSLVSKARENKLSDDDYNGGTITISNLGLYGVRQFASIIPPPQAIVLSVGTVEKRVIPSTDEKSVEEYQFAEMMTVTLSCDHRVVDGAVGAQWLAHFKGFVEEPVSMLL